MAIYDGYSYGACSSMFDFNGTTINKNCRIHYENKNLEDWAGFDFSEPGYEGVSGCAFDENHIFVLQGDNDGPNIVSGAVTDEDGEIGRILKIFVADDDETDSILRSVTKPSCASSGDYIFITASGTL